MALDAQRTDEAARAIERLLALVPRSVTGLGLLAELHLTQGDPAGALAALDRALAVAPDDLNLLNNRAGLRLRTGDVAGASTDAERMVSLRPEDPGPRILRAEILAAI